MEKSPVPCPKCSTPIPDVGDGAGVCPRCVLEFAFQADSGEQTGTVMKALPSAQDPPLSGLFGPYRILSVLGRGGMGVVYLAEQVSLSRRVALKVLPCALARDVEFTERFQREARAMATLSHPNIVTVFDSGCIDGRFYYVMEHVEGTSLRSLLGGRKLLPSRALEIVPQLCDALSYAHQKGVVHRDVKPENILIDRAGRAKIADFGLAKVLDKRSRTTSLTGTMQVLGTPHYIAPEQLERPKEVDHRADIYALGVVIYEMLTGELPIGKFDPPSWKAPVDARWDAIVMKAMEAEPERRYQAVSELKEESTRATAKKVGSAVVGAAIPGPTRRISTPPTWPGGRSATPLPERERMGTVALFIAAALGAVAIGAFLGRSESKPQEGAPAQVAQPTPPEPPRASPAVAQDLKGLDDDFQYRGLLSDKWLRLHETEPAPDPFKFPLRVQGMLMLVPHTSLWWGDFRGPLVYQPVDGDFVLTARFEIGSPAGKGQAPSKPYSVAGLMARAPRSATKESWKRGGENYFFLGLGRTMKAPFGYEVKNTFKSSSQKKDEWEGSSAAVLRLAWVHGDCFLIVKDPRVSGGAWHILMRGYRPDLPRTLQVGIACMTDTQTVLSRFEKAPEEYNREGCPDSSPELMAACCYAHFRRPAVPEDFDKRDLTQPWEPNLPEQYLLSFLGDAIRE